MMFFCGADLASAPPALCSSCHLLLPPPSPQVLGVVLSSIMIHQLRYRGVQRHPPTVLLSVPPVFVSTTPPKYQELRNPPAY